MIQILRRRYVITSNSCPVVGPNKTKAKNAANNMVKRKVLLPLSTSHLLNTCVSPCPKSVTSCPSITICSAIPPSLNGGNPLVANSFQLSGGYPVTVALCSINGGTFVTTCYSLSTLNGGTPTGNPTYYVNGGSPGGSQVCYISGS